MLPIDREMKGEGDLAKSVVTWENEPDEVIFVAEGFPAVILRHPHFKTLNGYLGLPGFHVYYGMSEIHPSLVGSPHGGWTWSAEHLPQREPDGNWWLGFDCAHPDRDFVPGMMALFPEEMMKNVVYRDIDYVKGELIEAAKVINANEETPDMHRVDLSEIEGLRLEDPRLKHIDWSSLSSAVFGKNRRH